MQLSAVILAVVASFGVAQAFNDLPTVNSWTELPACGLACIASLQADGTTTCAITDTECLCEDDDFEDAFSGCVHGLVNTINCSEEDFDIISNEVEFLCQGD